MQNYPVTAIEINSKTIVEVLSAFDPTLNELDYEKDLQGNFIVIESSELGQYAIITPETVGKLFDHIEPGKQYVLKLVQLFK